MKYNKTPLAKIAEILDKSISGGSYSKIGKKAGVNGSTVYNILADFPLWGFLRNEGVTPSKPGRPRKE